MFPKRKTVFRVARVSIQQESVRSLVISQGAHINDFTKVKISELIRFTEEQAEKERKNLTTDADSDRDASWAATLEMLKALKERGMPEALKDSDFPS